MLTSYRSWLSHVFNGRFFSFPSQMRYSTIIKGTNHIMLHNSHLGTAIHVERKQNFNKYKFGWEKSSSRILFLEFVLGERKLSIAQCISITLWSPTHSWMLTAKLALMSQISPSPPSLPRSERHMQRRGVRLCFSLFTDTDEFDKSLVGKRIFGRSGYPKFALETPKRYQRSAYKYVIRRLTHMSLG